jgi:hypothetical protein
MNIMNKLIKFGSGILMAIFVLAACEKIEPLKVYRTAETALLTASTSTVAAVPADSMKTIISFSWTRPAYSVDSNTVKYVLEILRDVISPGQHKKCLQEQLQLLILQKS